MPCHHNLEDYLSAYIDGCELREDRKGPLFRTIARGTKRLSETPLPQANAFAMVRRRAGAAEIGTAIGNHSFRATGITTYLKNGGTRSEEHTSELQSLMRISYAVFCLKKKQEKKPHTQHNKIQTNA